MARHDLARVALLTLCLGGTPALSQSPLTLTAAGGRTALSLEGAPLLTQVEPQVPARRDEPKKPWPCPSRELAVALEGEMLVLTDTLPSSGQVLASIASFRHAIDDAREIWTPHLAPADGYVMGDHAFRSPAFLAANGARALALVPDLDDVRAAHEAGWEVWMDYDHPSQTVTFAAGAYRHADQHVLYWPEPLECRGQPVRLRVHVLTSTDPADLANPYGLAARWIWDRWGHEGLLAGGAQRGPLAAYAEHINRWTFEPAPVGWGDTVWQSFTVNGRPCGGPAFIVDVAQHPSIPAAERRWREQRSVWNQAWFSTQRCANGLLRYARQVGSAELEQRARLMTALALSAPQTDGLFPAVYTCGGGGYSLEADTPGWEQARWTNSDRRPRGASGDAVHILDAAFTARLLLEWHGLTGEREALDYVLPFADRLVRLQRPSGAFPGWVEPDGTVPEALAEGPETAMGAAFLAELLLAELLLAESERMAPATRESLGRALRASLRYLIEGPIAEGRWEDFETYYSCSGWGRENLGKRVERNRQFKSNTFSPFWCAEALLAGYRLLGEVRYLAIGRRCLDELSLYQQVWDPPYIPAPCHGGFGVMNGDGEWNDARQSLFAPLFLEYYRETGDGRYFERGVSALRASFAMLYCPENAGVRKEYERVHKAFGPESFGFMMENVAHGGPDSEPIGPFTIYTWGNGAALASYGKIRDLYGDVYVDRARGQVFGIDGCRASLAGDKVSVEDPYGQKELTLVDETGRRTVLRTGE